MAAYLETPGIGHDKEGTKHGHHHKIDLDRPVGRKEQNRSEGKKGKGNPSEDGIIQEWGNLVTGFSDDLKQGVPVYQNRRTPAVIYWKEGKFGREPEFRVNSVVGFSKFIDKPVLYFQTGYYLVIVLSVNRLHKIPFRAEIQVRQGVRNI